MSNIIDSIQLSGVTYQIQGSGGGVPESVFTAYTASTDSRIGEDEEVTAAALNALDEKIDSISGGGNPTVELTQAQYDALVTAGTVSADTYYIITDAQAGDLTNYYTKSETNTLLNGKQATLVSGTNIKTINNESILGSGNIDIQGGGKAVSGGTNISITTGETADTINCTLPYYKLNDNDNYSIFGKNSSQSFINKATNAYQTTFIGCTNEVIGDSSSWSYYNNLVLGYNNKINAHITDYLRGNNVVIGDHNSLSGTNLSDSYVIGKYSSGYTSHTLLTGWYNKSYNSYESAFGHYNNSVSASTTFGNSGNTLFSVGNGTANNARHNAFEIRQNGDIYLSLNGQDVKLQDQLGGSSITVDTALDSGSTNPVENRVIYNKIDEVEQVTAAGLNAVNNKFGGLKLVSLTQAEYNALATKDASTLYIIVN